MYLDSNGQQLAFVCLFQIDYTSRTCLVCNRGCGGAMEGMCLDEKYDTISWRANVVGKLIKQCFRNRYSSQK